MFPSFFPKDRIEKFSLGFAWITVSKNLFPCVWEGSLWFVCPSCEQYYIWFYVEVTEQANRLGYIIRKKKKGNNWNSVNYCNDCKIFAIMNIWTANVLRVNSSTCLSFEMSYFSPSFSIWLLRVTLSFLVSFTLQRHVV